MNVFHRLPSIGNFRRSPLGILRGQRFASMSMTNGSDELKIKLYQYHICPFCNKVKALLDYAAQPYEIVEVNPLTKSELKFPHNEYMKVPIAFIDGRQVNESDEIIDALLHDERFNISLHQKFENDLKSEDPIIGSNFSSKMDHLSFDNSETMKWSAWATNDLAATLYPNLCRSLSDSYRAFQYVEDVEAFTYIQRKMIRSVGSLAMYMAASRIKSKSILNYLIFSNQNTSLNQDLYLREKTY